MRNVYTMFMSLQSPLKRYALTRRQRLLQRLCKQTVGRVSHSAIWRKISPTLDLQSQITFGRVTVLCDRYKWMVKFGRRGLRPSYLRFSNAWKNRVQHVPMFGNVTTTMLHGFTLLELLIVVGIVSIFIALLIPGLSIAKSSSERAHCAGNLKQLYMANNLYASDHGYYVPAQYDHIANIRRWWKDLAPYLDGNGIVRQCPGFSDFSENGFEAGCGGYGYNDIGVGSRAYISGYNRESSKKGMPPGAIRKPVETVMFADCAYKDGGGRGTEEKIIEYSFAEAYHDVMSTVPETSSGTAVPSIHFRHRGKANVIWCDGHVSAETMTHSTKSDKPYNIGWFGGKNNDLFDPF